jgi:CBS domain containing-hemolysin-like protein
MSLIEALVWGYGERPSRIIATAVVLLTMYSFAFYVLLNKYHTASVSFVDCAYLSIVTFTTLGYGDITPKTSLMKMACGSEAAIGAFVLGLVVAGFANRSRY